MRSARHTRGPCPLALVESCKSRAWALGVALAVLRLHYSVYGERAAAGGRPCVLPGPASRVTAALSVPRSSVYDSVFTNNGVLYVYACGVVTGVHMAHGSSLRNGG